MREFSAVAVFFTLFILSSSSVSGQTSYSLHDLAKLADQHSETIKIAEDDVFIAQQDKIRALSVLIPRATAYGAATHYKHPDMAAPNTLTLGMKLTQSFTLNGKELIAYDVTKDRIVTSKLLLESARSQYFFQVAQNYYNILSAKGFFEIALADVKRLETHKSAVNEKLAVGNVTKTDLYRANAELSKAMTEKVKAENTIMSTRASLQNLVEIDPGFTLQDDSILGDKTYLFSVQEIQTQALQNRPEIKEADKNIEILQKTIKFEKSNYWPSISLEAGYKETDIEYDASPSDISDDTEDLYVSGELVFTLYDGGLRKADIAKAATDLRKAKQALSLQKKKVVLESEISFLDHETAKRTLINLEDELQSAQENFNAVKMQFEYGMADSIDIMDANTLLVSAQRRILDARYVYYLSVLKILYTKGELVDFLLNPDTTVLQ